MKPGKNLSTTTFFRQTFVFALSVITILLSFSSLSAQKKRPDYKEVPCSVYWRGLMVHTFDPWTGIEVKRKRRKQIEYNPKTGEKTKWKIEWVDDCKYELTFKKSNVPTKMRKGWIKKVQIVDCFDKFYNWDADINGIKYFGTLEKRLSKRQKKRKMKEEQREREQFIKDSTRMAIEDSLAIVHGWDLDSLKQARIAEAEKKAGKEEKVKEGEEDPGENTETEEGPEARVGEEGTEEGSESEENEEGDEKPDKKKKKDKKKKEKKEKKKKEKKPKKEKEPKEKKEKPPKEKKEKEKKNKEESGEEESED